MDVLRARGERGQEIYDQAMPRTDTASRLIAAPREQVYAALVDPEALTAWLPPGDMTGAIEHFDTRPGGSYRNGVDLP